MVICAEAPQLDLFTVLDLLRITVTPLDGHLGIRIGVYEDVESTVAI